MTLYLDTSALVKKYFQEKYSDEILSLWRQAEEIITSSVAYAESMACFYRKKREVDLEEKLIQTIVDSFHLDWKGFFRVEVTDDLNEMVDRLVGTYPLRGFDALHLASAVLLRERLPGDFLFACFDQRLAHAARAEGIETFPQ